MSLQIKFPKAIFTNYYDERDDNYICEYPSLSIDNEYIPIHALNEGEMIAKDNIRAFLYKLVVPVFSHRTTKYNVFCEYLGRFDNQDTRWVRLQHISAGQRKYIANNNMLLYIQPEISTKIIPMIVFAVRARYLFEINRENPDVSQFCLLVNRQFITDQDHFKVFRNIKKYYLDKMENEVDVLYTNDILKVCYNNKSMVHPKFKTVQEMVDSGKDINDLLTKFIQLDEPR